MKPYQGILAFISYFVLQILVAHFISVEHYEAIAGVIALLLSGWLLHKKWMLHLSSRDLKGSQLFSCVGIGLALIFKVTFLLGVLIQPAALEQSPVAPPVFWVEYTAVKVVLIPIVEELLFRGIMFGSFASSFSYKLAILFSAVIFAPTRSMIAWPMVLLIGIMLVWIYWRTNNLAVTMVIHIAINFFFLLSIPLYALLAVNRTLRIMVCLLILLLGVGITYLCTKKFLQKHDTLPA